MLPRPKIVDEFLHGRRFAVAGVSRDSRQAANAIFRKLRHSGYEVFPINPKATSVEGVPCFPDLGALCEAAPGPIDGVVIATSPQAAVDVVRQCSQHGIGHVWLHRSFGQGSVSELAVEDCAHLGLTCIVGGCPLMYCEPVDLGHRCMRWWLRWRGRIPG